VKPRPEDDRAAPLAATVTSFALMRAVGVGMTVVAALLIAFAALLLSLAWHVGPEVVVSVVGRESSVLTTRAASVGRRRPAAHR